jgi:hypothetical protein
MSGFNKILLPDKIQNVCILSFNRIVWFSSSYNVFLLAAVRLYDPHAFTQCCIFGYSTDKCKYIIRGVLFYVIIGCALEMTCPVFVIQHWIIKRQEKTTMIQMLYMYIYYDK